MNTFSDELLDKVKNIQTQVDKFQTLDLDNLVDLKRAKETIRVIKGDFESLITKNPYYAHMVEIISEFMDFDIKSEINKWAEFIDAKIEEVKNKEVIKTEHSGVSKYTTDKTENVGDCGYFNECNGCPHRTKCDPDYFDDDNDFNLFLITSPLTGQELVDNYLNEDFIKCAKFNEKTVEVYANVIAKFINKEHPNFNRKDDSENIESLSNTLFRFITHIMKQ